MRRVRAYCDEASLMSVLAGKFCRSCARRSQVVCSKESSEEGSRPGWPHDVLDKACCNCIARGSQEEASGADAGLTTFEDKVALRKISRSNSWFTYQLQGPPGTRTLHPSSPPAYRGAPAHCGLATVCQASAKLVPNHVQTIRGRRPRGPWLCRRGS